MEPVIHRAMIVTSCDNTISNAAAIVAKQYGLSITSIASNYGYGHYASFMIIPSGGHQDGGIDESYQTSMSHFIEWLKEQKYPSGAPLFEWAIVEYGNQMDGEPRIVAHAWEER